ncbi:MAG: M15 family metallopeptidase [Candidatus Howiella sp.]|jgi:D-alanyl-D-alanine carboxypeptidase
MRRRKKQMLILGGTAIALTVLFIILMITSNHMARINQAERSTSSEIVASEARDEVSVVSILDSDSSAQETSDSPSSLSSAAASVPASSVTATSAAASSGAVQISDGSGSWNLRLVNGKYKLPDDFSPDLATIPNYNRDAGMKFDRRAVDALMQMCDAAKADGVNLLIISAYRSYNTQASLYNNKVNYYLNQGYGREEAEDLAATVVARPQTSEHNLGLAVDINSVEEDFDQTEAFTWLQNNCTKYGFIMRYPKNKESITGVIYEPWHYRYVGVGIADQIMKKGTCLEEYLGKQ